MMKAYKLDSPTGFVEQAKLTLAFKVFSIDFVLILNIPRDY